MTSMLFSSDYLPPSPDFNSEGYPLSPSLSTSSLLQHPTPAQLFMAQLQEANQKIISDSQALFISLEEICQNNSKTLHHFLDEFFTLFLASNLKVYVKKYFLEKFVNFFYNASFNENLILFLAVLCDHKEIFKLYTNENVFLAYQHKQWEQILLTCTPQNPIEKEIYLIALFQKKPPKYLEVLTKLYAPAQLCAAEIETITHFSNAIHTPSEIQDNFSFARGFGLVKVTRPLLFSFYMTLLRQQKYSLHPLNASFELELRSQESVANGHSPNTICSPSPETVEILSLDTGKQEADTEQDIYTPQVYTNGTALTDAQPIALQQRTATPASPPSPNLAVTLRSNKRPPSPTSLAKPAKQTKTESSQSLSAARYQGLYFYSNQSDHPKAVSPLVIANNFLNGLIRQKANLAISQIQRVIEDIKQHHLDPAIDPNFLALKINPEPFEKMSQSSSGRLTQQFIERLYFSMRPSFNPNYFTSLEAVSPKVLIQKFLDGLNLPKGICNDYYLHFFSQLNADIKRRIDSPQATIDYLAPKLQKFWKLLAKRVLLFESVKLKNLIRKILEKNISVLLDSKLGFLTFISHAFAPLQRHHFFFNANDYISKAILLSDWNATSFSQYLEAKNIDNFDTFEKLLFIELMRSTSQENPITSEIDLMFQFPPSIKKLHHQAFITEDISLLQKFTQTQFDLVTFDRERNNPISNFPILFSYAYFFLRKKTKFPPSDLNPVLFPYYLEHMRQQERISIYQVYLAKLNNKFYKKLGFPLQDSSTLQADKK